MRALILRWLGLGYVSTELAQLKHEIRQLDRSTFAHRDNHRALIIDTTRRVDAIEKREAAARRAFEAADAFSRTVRAKLYGDRR
jgi:hypothetical protein